MVKAPWWRTRPSYSGVQQPAHECARTLCRTRNSCLCTIESTRRRLFSCERPAAAADPGHSGEDESRARCKCPDSSDCRAPLVEDFWEWSEEGFGQPRSAGSTRATSGVDPVDGWTWQKRDISAAARATNRAFAARLSGPRSPAAGRPDRDPKRLSIRAFCTSPRSPFPI